jgi:Family of unknown function (DUF5681)
MSSRSTKGPEGNKPRSYEVGYGKPPMHTRFRKGVSGNPRGGSRTQRAARATALALKEAYRMVTVREGDKITSPPAIQSVMRSQVALAVKGNGPAQRALIAAIHALEQQLAIEAAAKEKAEAERPPINYTDSARRIAFILRLAYEEKGEKLPQGDLMDQIVGLIGPSKPKTGG